MSDERKRIDKLVRDGKVSAEEAEQLGAALEKSEREETQAPPGPREEIGKPRLSRLALGGALGLPAAGVTFLFVMGLAIVFGAHEERAVVGGLMMAAAVALAGIGLSIAGLVVTRRQPDRFSGGGLALAGIVAPVVLTVLASVGIGIARLHYVKRMAAREREMVREAERFMRERMREERQHCISFARQQLSLAWQEFSKPITNGGFTGTDKELREIASAIGLEPGWAADIEANGPSKDDLATTVLSPRFIALLAANGKAAEEAEMDVDIDAGRGVVSLKVGPRARRVTILVPSTRGRARRRAWSLARAPLDFPDGEPEWPALPPPNRFTVTLQDDGSVEITPAANRFTVTIQDDGSVEIASAADEEAVATSLRDFVAEPGRFFSGVDKPTVEIKADPKAPFDEVAALLDALKKAGVTDVTFRTE